MKTSWVYFVIIVMGFQWAGCNPDGPDTDFHVDFGYDYFPLEVGKYIDYQVDSFVYDTTAQGVLIDTASLMVRESVTDTFRNLSNELTYRIERASKYVESDPWEIASVYTASRSTSQAFRTEDNFKYIKMVYPLKVGEIWDGNLFIDKSTIITVAGETIEIFKDWSYEVEELDQIDVVNNMGFDSVAVIYQAQNENLIELRHSVEKYAKGLGLIYREMKILDTQCIENCIGETWEEKAEKGFIFRQSIIGHN